MPRVGSLPREGRVRRLLELTQAPSAQRVAHGFRSAHIAGEPLDRHLRDLPAGGATYHCGRTVEGENESLCIPLHAYRYPVCFNNMKMHAKTWTLLEGSTVPRPPSDTVQVAIRIPRE